MSNTMSEPVLDKTPPDAPSFVVVGEKFFPMLQTLKLVGISIFFVYEAAFLMTAPLTRVGWNIFVVEIMFSGLVFDMLLELAERPQIELDGIRNTLADTSGCRAPEPCEWPPRLYERFVLIHSSLPLCIVIIY